MRSSSLTRKVIRAIVGVCVLLLAGLSILYFRQHSMVYHPRPYDESYAYALPADGVEINYAVAGAACTAYYIPCTQTLPKRLWLAFCGNGSLALDWTTILRDYPWNGDAFLLIDYPGYGKNSGYATIASTRVSADAALKALTERLHTDEDHLTLCAIGHSLGSAVALDFATHHRVEKIVLVAPFTTLREEAATIFGGWIARLLIESYDNRENLREIATRNPDPRVAIFHGTDDDVIPVRMSRELACEFPFLEFFAVEGADHVSVLNHAHDEIINWMTRQRVE
ncbi:MAG TPA: alpha/beta fold hydrolase [Chthoniobacterales bacterium]|nr:alpha/beta fold hydrolase [Chthoniobacterales bacterium]